MEYRCTLQTAASAKVLELGLVEIFCKYSFFIKVRVVVSPLALRLVLGVSAQDSYPSL